MIDRDEARHFAESWIEAWNSHDLDRILAHYAADVAFNYGLGLFNPAQRACVTAVGHLGANFGYKSSAGCVTEDQAIFALC